METERKIKIKLHTLNGLNTLIFYLSILIFIIGFGFRDTPTPFGWYQQFIPNIGNRTISDITFLDSLNGYAIGNSTSDTNYFLKTTDRGDSWQIIYRRYLAFEKLQFLNLNTGYMCGAYLWKTTDGGFNWNQVSAPPISPEGLYVIDENTIWIISSDPLTGGVFRTTNGGTNWTQQLDAGSSNPDHIYMYNSRIGFIASENGGTRYLRKTTDSGFNWILIGNSEYFHTICFVDSLTGWKSSVYGMKKTTDGGVSWSVETLPSGGIIQSSGISDFSVLNRDTLWGAGGYVVYPNNQLRGIFYRTTNGGDTWLFQIPDTTIHLSSFSFFVRFTDKNHGWGYSTIPTGLHTVTGGDSAWLTEVKQISTEVPKDFKLFQNFPNPFNPVTNIRYELKNKGNVLLKVFDISGKEVITLVNQRQNAGMYQVDFSGSNLSSGVYFYSLFVNDIKVDTKKMILIR